MNTWTTELAWEGGVHATSPFILLLSFLPATSTLPQTTAPLFLSLLVKQRELYKL